MGLWDFTNIVEIAKENMKGFCAFYRVCDGSPKRLSQGIKHGKAIDIRQIAPNTELTDFCINLSTSGEGFLIEFWPFFKASELRGF